MNDDDDPRNEREVDAVSRFVRTLRDTWHMPVSFIQANDESDEIRVRASEHMQTMLDALISQAPVYRWSHIVEHYVVYPRTRIWDAQVGDVQIANVPRLKAATQFILQARAAIPELADLSEPPMLGDPCSAVYSQLVSLPPTTSILEHLVALLGPDPRIVFTVELTRFGDRVLHFDRVPE
jgi:hypothetical protein